MTVKHASKELVHGSRFSAENVHTEAGKFGSYILAYVSSLLIVQPPVCSLYTSDMIGLLL
jgi:hypothetical protein